jgi:hypothetical protein
VSGLLGGSRPDLTPAQVVGLVPVLAALLAAFGVYDLSEDQQEALSDAITAALVLFGADAALRAARNHREGKVEAAALATGSEPAAPLDPEVELLADGDLPDDEEEFAGALGGETPDLPEDHPGDAPRREE